MKWEEMDFTKRSYFIISFLALGFLLFSLIWQTVKCQDLNGLKTGGIAGSIAIIIRLVINKIEK